MKRPRHWLRWLFLVCLLLVLGEYVTLTWVAPRYLIRTIQRFVGGELTVERATLSFPLTTLVSGIRSQRNSPEAAVVIQHVLIWPRSLWVSPRIAKIDAVTIDHPFLRITRTASGALRWPHLGASTAAPHDVAARRPPRAVSWLLKRWQVQVDTVEVVDGVIEFIDEQPSPPFHAVFDHVKMNVGPVSFPAGDTQMSFAVHGVVSGYAGYAAPAYCSGWIGLSAKDLQVSCQLEPLTLALFDPYFQRSPVIRVYSATVTSTSQWLAKSNRLDARVHLELDHLTEGDISVRGHTLFDIKKLAGDSERKLVGEISLGGALDAPDQWRGEFIPGNPPAQRLVAQLLERNIKVLTVPMGAHRLGLRLAAASEAAMQDIEAVSKDISEALDILATPMVPEATLPTPEAQPTPAGVSGAPGPAPAGATGGVGPAPEVSPATPPAPPTQSSAPATP